MSKVITVLNTLEVQLRPLSGFRKIQDFSKEAYIENLVKIASELSVLEPI